jgi:hypothetical protein
MVLVASSFAVGLFAHRRQYGPAEGAIVARQYANEPKASAEVRRAFDDGQLSAPITRGRADGRQEFSVAGQVEVGGVRLRLAALDALLARPPLAASLLDWPIFPPRPEFLRLDRIRAR